MGRYILAVCRQCRRAKEKLYIKGDKCALAKCPVVKRPYAPGQHGKAPTRVSDFGMRLREKQKARQIYGLSETQFKNYFAKARTAKGITGSILLELLERRLDNVVYRLGLSTSRAGARQLVRHGHILVNGRKTNIPSFQVKPGNILLVKEKTAAMVKKVMGAAQEKKAPAWLELNGEKLEGKVIRTPLRQDIDTLIDEQKIVEYYSR